MDYYQFHTYAWDGSFDGHSPFEVSMPFYQYDIRYVLCGLVFNVKHKDAGYHINSSD